MSNTNIKCIYLFYNELINKHTYNYWLMYKVCTASPSLFKYTIEVIVLRII